MDAPDGIDVPIRSGASKGWSCSILQKKRLAAFRSRVAVSRKWGSGSNGTKSSIQPKTPGKLLARDRCMSWCTTGPSDSALRRLMFRRALKVGFLRETDAPRRAGVPNRTFGSVATGPPASTVGANSGGGYGIPVGPQRRAGQSSRLCRL